jgi:predicted transcriptional regulator
MLEICIFEICIGVMHVAPMSDAATLRQGLTVRLAPDLLDRVRGIAEAEHRSAAAYLEQLVERDLAARDEAERVVRVFVDPALEGAADGAVAREADEDATRHGRRVAALDRLFGAGD